ncbi:neprilysin-4-like [Musca vetustissima]|uniref:neprilysin-4-like n=1 Tax=Musca vetustissima TaxID=27455 RepID=UPI002AB60FE3|nr:neprilysin-4-like [Musca vetustissima]
MIKQWLIVVVIATIGVNGNSFNTSDEYTLNIIRYSKAAEIHNLMDERVDPCDNFYAFACGKWNRINPANSFETITTGFFETVQKALNRKIAEVLADDEDAKGYTAIDKKVKNFYESCMNLSALKATYKDKLMAIVKEFGSMPVLEGDNWQEDEFDWLQVVAKIAHKYEISIMLGFDIMADFADNSMNRVYVGQAELPLESRSMYLEEGNAIYRHQYQENIATNLRTFLGVEASLARQTAKEILDFEIGLARGLVDDKLGLQLDELTSLTTIDELQMKYAPTLDIKRLLRISLGSLPTDEIYEVIEDYQINLVSLLKTTPKRQLANYIFYTLLENFMLKIPKNKNELRTKCIANTKKYFAKNLDNMVYRIYNTNDTERGVEFMWREIQNTFQKMLLSDRMNWIKKETRNYAVEKLYAMKIEINSYEKTNFSEEFGQLVVNKHDFVENLKSAMMLSAKNSRKKLYEPPAPLDAGELLSFTPANILIENRIKVPVSLLQPFYVWSNTYPNALKYGTLGSLISHELIHGFDDTGRNFDKFGNSRNWWDDKSTEAFKNRTKCFVDQYKNYIYNGKLLPEMASQSENIADNSGVRLAYAAYQHWYDNAMRSRHNMESETLPRLKYNGKQLFFISYAQIWCSDIHPAMRNLQTSTDTHVPGKFRVIGPLSNFPEFSREFNCPLGSNMNPVSKCIIY